MKILITTDTYKPTVNGVVTSIVSLTNGLEAAGHEVRVLTLSGSAKSYQDGNATYIGSVSVGKIYPGARIKTAMSHRYIKALIAWKPEIVHSQSEFSTFFLAKRIAHLCHAPLIHTYHTVYEDYTHYFSPNIRFGKFMAAEFSRRILTKTQLVIAPTDKVKAMLMRYGVAPPIVTIPSGLLLHQFTNVRSDTRSKIRNQLKIKENEIILLFVGRLAEEKNIEELFGHLSELPSEARLLLVGDGPRKEALRTLAEQENLGSRVIFAGMISPQEIADYYAAGDVFVSASQSETQGLTYIEAMASGLPLLCKKDDCLDSVIQNGQNGFVYDSRSEFAQLAHALCSDISLRKQIGAQAQKDVCTHYSSIQFAQSAMQAYCTAQNHRTETIAVGAVITDKA